MAPGIMDRLDPVLHFQLAHTSPLLWELDSQDKTSRSIPLEEIRHKSLRKRNKTVEVQIELAAEPSQVKSIRVSQVEDTLCSCVQEYTVDIRVGFEHTGCIWLD